MAALPAGMCKAISYQAVLYETTIHDVRRQSDRRLSCVADYPGVAHARRAMASAEVGAGSPSRVWWRQQSAVLPRPLED